MNKDDNIMDPFASPLAGGRKLQKSNSMTMHLKHPYSQYLRSPKLFSANYGGLKSASSEFLAGHGFGEVPLVNDSLLDLFPGLIPQTKKHDDLQHQQQPKTPRNYIFAASPPISARAGNGSGGGLFLFSNSGNNLVRDPASSTPASPGLFTPPSTKRSRAAGGKAGKKNLLTLFKPYDDDMASGSHEEEDSSMPPSTAGSSCMTSPKTASTSSRRASKAVNSGTVETTPTLKPHHAMIEALESGGAQLLGGYQQQPATQAEKMAVRLAQHALDLSLLPKRVKLLRNVSDKMIEQFSKGGPDGSAEEDSGLEAIWREDEARMAGTAVGLAGASLSGTSPPIKYVVLSALSAPVPRSAGTPTNVPVPEDLSRSSASDYKALKRLRNRISASRCRLRKRVWTMGLERCERGLGELTRDLQAYVDQLEHEKQSLQQILSLAHHQSS